MPFRNTLRPVFFRVDGCTIATGGWISVETQDIWANTADLYALALMVPHCGCGVAQRLLELQTTEDHGLVIVPKAQLALTLGERVEFCREVDMFPFDVIEKGERAVVGRRDKCTGMVELFLEQHHIKLADSYNCLSCEPHNDVDLLGAIRPYRDRWTAPTFVDLAEYVKE